MNVYIAGPFFNSEQIRHIDMIEKVLEAQNVDYFSPCRHNFCPPNANKQRRRHAFRRNVAEIQFSDVVLAVLDYLLPEGQTLQISKREKDGTFGLFSPPLNLPDVGTVFEMGVALQAKVPILGFTVAKEPRQFNLMLAETLSGAVFSFEELAKFFSRTELDWEVTRPLKGEIQ